MLFKILLDEFHHNDSGRKGQNRDGVMDSPLPLSFLQADAQQYDISCLGIGEHPSPEKITVRIQKSPDNSQNGTQLKGLGHLDLLMLFH